MQVLLANGCTDQFVLPDTAASVLPVPTTGMRLTSPPLGLSFLSTIDRHGNPQAFVGVGAAVATSPAGASLSATLPLSPSSPSTTTSTTVIASSLESLWNGLVGQINSDGCFVLYEWIDYKDDTIYDLKPLHVILPPQGQNGRRPSLDGKLALLPRTGTLAYVSGDDEGSLGVTICSAFGDFAPTTLPLSSPAQRIDCLAWIPSDQSLVVAVVPPEGPPQLRIFRRANEEYLLALQFPLHSDVPVRRVTALVASPGRGGSILCCVELQDGSQSFLLYGTAQSISTSGCTSRLAFLQHAHQIMHLRISQHTLSASFTFSSGSDDGIAETTINLRDASLLWELIDVPFDTFLRGSLNGPPRLVVADAEGEWLAVAGGLMGFCLCHLRQRKWLLFEDPSEEAEIRVDLLEWVNVPGLGGGKVLAVVGHVLSSGKNEFWLLSPDDPLTVGRLLHRQEARKRVLALCSSGSGQLGILSEDLLLQIIKLTSESTDTLSISILISASLDAFRSSAKGASLADWKVFFATEVHVESTLFHLFLIKHHCRVWKVLVPPKEDQDHRNVVAHIFPVHDVADMWVWQPADQLWLILHRSDGQLHCYRWPFVVDQPNFVVKLAGPASALYPNLAGGMVLGLEQLLHMGLNERDMHRIGVGETVALLPHLLHDQLRRTNMVEFSELLRQLVHSFKDRPRQFMLICELFYLQILTDESSKEGPNQETLFARLAEMLPAILGPATFRATVAGFVRKIELADAAWVVQTLGSFEGFLEVGPKGKERAWCPWLTNLVLTIA